MGRSQAAADKKCRVLCLAAGEAGGWDSDREGQMETKTSVRHGSRNAGKTPPRLLRPFFLSSLQQAAVSPSLPVPSSGFSTCESSGTLSFLHISLLVFGDTCLARPGTPAVQSL